MTEIGHIVPDTALSERQRWLLLGLPFTRTRYVLDAESLKQLTGILFPVTRAVSLSQVRSIDVKRSGLQTVFGLSTISVATDDPVVSELVLRNIRNGAAFEERLHRCLANNTQAQSLYTTE